MHKTADAVVWIELGAAHPLRCLVHNLHLLGSHASLLDGDGRVRIQARQHDNAAVVILAHPFGIVLRFLCQVKSVDVHAGGSTCPPGSSSHVTLL